MYYLYFSDKRFAFQATVYNDCQDVFIMSVDIKRITSLSIYDIDYRYSIAEITESEAIDLLKNADLSEKR